MIKSVMTPFPYFVDMDETCPNVKLYYVKLERCADCENAYCTLATDKGCPANYSEVPRVHCGDCTQCIHPLGLKIVYFIMQAMRMQRQCLDLSIPPSKEGVEETLGHYLRIPEEDRDEKNDSIPE